MTNIQKCVVCERDYDAWGSEQGGYIYNRGYVCKECADKMLENEELWVCSDCGEYIQDGEEMEYNGDIVCSGCYNAREEEEDWEDEDNENGILHYHSNEGRGDESGGNRYRIGFEIEKEDDSVRSYLANNLYDVLEKIGWAIEGDCSLDSSGFEAVSPIYPLDIEKLSCTFQDDYIKQIAEADFSGRCGGHITISDVERTPQEVIDDIAGYLPILYAIYPKRVFAYNCAYKKDLLKDVYTHRSLSCRGRNKGDGVEFRIFNATDTVDDNIERAKFLKYMLEHKATTLSHALKFLSDDGYFRENVLRLLTHERINEDEFRANIAKYSTDSSLDKFAYKTALRKTKKLQPKRRGRHAKV